MREMETAAEKTATNKKEAGGKTGYCLHFNANDLRSFSLASEIVTLFQHQLSREVSKISDKLIVSAFSSLHFILKMHLYGFTRESLHRMSEAINVYRSPELNTIVDDLLTHVFKSYIRRVRNGIYRYRFSSGFEQELRYISQIHELESATYNFSLDSMRYVKRFFENILVKSDSEKTGLISRSHITLGEMCAIEQSYTAASVHYSAASQILAKKLSKMRSPLNQEVLMLYTEAMIKHGDLEERRQNYNYAAAIYSDAESTIKTLSSDPELAASLQKGDSKWDLLKQPFWASRFLSLKRSPSPGRVESPRYLYQKRDPRFHYRAANLSFFLGEAASAAKFYSTTRRYANKSIDSQLPDERSGYLDGKAMVGLVESILMYQSRELFKILSKRELSTTEKKQEFEKKLLDNFRGVRDDRNIAHQLNKAAKRFEENRLYISAAITHIKAICYYTAILDAFDNSTFSDNDDYKRELLRHTNEIYKGIIITSGADAIRCIDKARQLETSQSNKTLLIYDFEYKHGFAEKDITMLFDMLFGSGVAQDYPANESLFWQNSVWAHKLIATLYWAEYVKRKIEQEAVGFESSKKIPGNIPRDLSVSGFSVRSSILMCWIHARDLSRRYIDKKLVVFDEKPRHRNVIHNLFEKAEKARLTATGEEIAAYLRNFQNKEIPFPETLEKAYLISRYLYFAQKSSRMISRKNLDLIFPRLSQIHYTQWKLLQNLISTMFVKPGEISEDFSGSHQMNSVRDISFLVQRAFVAIDEKLEPDERIAPSHFDFEFISMRLNDSLESSISLVDRTSRTHTGIFQHKYFCHDDHGDPDFRMDYTLAQMFTPMAQYLYLELKETDPMLKSILALSSRKVASCIN